MRGSAVDNPLDDRVGCDAFALGGETDHDPVPQDRRGERADVLGRAWREYRRYRSSAIRADVPPAFE